MKRRVEVYSISVLVMMATHLFTQPKFISKSNNTKKEKKVVLVVRDGPYLTKEFINVLNKYNVKGVVFCLIGKRITDKTAEFLKLIIENGNILCNQGFLHKRYSEFKSFGEAKIDMKRVIYKIEKYTGLKPQIAWAPYAELSPKFLKSVKAHKIPYIILPSFYTRDWEQPATITLNDIKSKVKPRDIILLHEVPETLKALPLILEFLKNKGYQIVSLFENLNITNIKGKFAYK